MAKRMWWMIYVMYEIDHVLLIGITTCMSWVWQPAGAIGVVLIYCMTCVSMKTPCNYFTFLLTVSYSSRSNSWRDNFMKTRWWRSWCHAGDNDDHGAPKMEIKSSKMILAISCHYLIACDVYHVLHLICLDDGSINKMIPRNNFKKVFPLTVHNCESSSFRSTTWWSGVIDSNVRIQWV